MSTQPQKYFFVHLQKTAGTSFYLLLKRHFALAEIYPDETDGDRVASILSVPHLQERWAARGDQIRIVTGHFPYCTAELLGGGFATLTVLREPVERTLSYLRHHRVLTADDRDKPLEAIYDDPFRFNGLIHNHMTKMFSLTVDEMTDGALTNVEFTPERLERAKQNLATVDAIGLLESFDDFWAELPRRFGWDLGEVVHTNRTEPTEVPDGFRERIAADNAMDIAFYEYARDLVAERKANDEVAGRAGRSDLP
jgi:hypothetical protein